MASRTTRRNGGTSPLSRSPIPTRSSIFRSHHGNSSSVTLRSALKARLEGRLQEHGILRGSAQCAERLRMTLEFAVLGLLVAVDALAPLVALLRLDAQGRDRPRIEAFQADRLAGLLAIAVGAIVEAHYGGVDLGDQLPLTVAGAKLERPLGLRGCPVGDVGVLRRIVVQVLEGLLGRAEDLVTPAEQLAAEIGPLALAHEAFVFRWAIIFGDFSFGPHGRFQTHPFPLWV